MMTLEEKTIWLAVAFLAAVALLNAVGVALIDSFII